MPPSKEVTALENFPYFTILKLRRLRTLAPSPPSGVRAQRNTNTNYGVKTMFQEHASEFMMFVIVPIILFLLAPLLLYIEKRD